MRVLLLAGEESGLVYAEALKKYFPAGTEFRGYQDHFKTVDLAVMGFGPVLMKLFFFIRVARVMKKEIVNWKPDVVITIDYPGMNLKLAEFAKKRGIPAVHLVCPQVWAWHRDRIPKIPKKVNRLLCFLPFEPAMFNDYESEEFKAIFIGHPMVDVFAEERENFSKVSRVRKLIALLPGSRRNEIERILPVMLEAVGKMSGELRFVIPAATPSVATLIRSMVIASHLENVHVIDGGARVLLHKADCAAVASGTATLEAALACVPTALVYRTSRFLAWFARTFVHGITHIGLANIIAEKLGTEPPMPEILQEEFTADNLAAQLNLWLESEDENRRAKEKLARTMQLLSSDGKALERAAKIAIGLVSE